LVRFQQLAFPPDRQSGQPGPSPRLPNQAPALVGWSPGPSHGPLYPSAAPHGAIPDVGLRHQPPESSGRAGPSLYVTPPLAHRVPLAWGPLPPPGALPPPSSVRGEEQRTRLPSLSGPGRGMGIEHSSSPSRSMSKTRDMSIANLVNAPVSRSTSSVYGLSPYSVDPTAPPIIGPSRQRLPAITSPRSLPYPLTASSSVAGSSGIHLQSSESYSRDSVASDSDTSTGSDEQDGGVEDEMDDEVQDPHEAAVPSTANSPSRGEQSG
jgi:hypothetical protein